MIRTAVFLCCLLFSGAGYSQFSDSVHYHLSYAATGTINRATEGRSYVLNNAFAFDVSKKNISLNNSNSWVYGETNGQKNINDFFSTLNFDVNRALKLWYFWGLASYTTSYSLQIESQFQAGVAFGLSQLMAKGAITLKDGVVEQNNFGEYRVARMPDMPPLAVHIVPSAEPPTGIGEPGLPPLAPAFANAIARATGKPAPRELPFKLA